MRHIALDVPAGSPPSAPRTPVSVVLVTDRITRARAGRARRRSNVRPDRLRRPRFERRWPRRPARACRARHSNSTWARMVKAAPAGGAAKEKVQPAWRRPRLAEPAKTQGETPEPATGVQAWFARLQ